MSDSQRPIAVIILAAGHGTRMKSRRPKVLHELCGRPMLGHVLGIAETLAPERLIVVIGRDADRVRELYAGRCEFVVQAEPRGTGHAALQAEPKLAGFDGDVLVLYADTPLLRGETLRSMQIEKHRRGADLLLLTAEAPTIPGRVLRDAAGRVEGVVEAQDASPEQAAIAERNTGVYLVEASLLRTGLARLEDDNAQGELYLTDVIRDSVQAGRSVEAMHLEDADECLGINTREELAQATRVMRGRIASRLMAEGVTLIDPERTYVDVDVEIGRDTLIEPGCVIQGDTVIGEGCHLKAHTIIESSRIDDGAEVGPSSHLRSGTHLQVGVRIGNFVEIKNAVLGPGTKAAHLTYIGDADVGARVNFGCGSVVVNYDGIDKYRTSVGDDVFIGCNVNLISPVRLANHCFIAAGSTINREVPEDALAVARARQRNVEGWMGRRKSRVDSRERDRSGGPAAELEDAGKEAGEKGAGGKSPVSAGSKS
jgi:bifunctional UDP-N-acetylglucosamine pyrophosphorylase/glucosamine-1-phosphate N-acetyltransferase